MISTLIISVDKKTREQFALDFCSNLYIDKFDITTFQPENSLGIEDVREIQKKSLFKPLKSKEKALVLYDAQLATSEAQNALLKLLEEPPLHTYIILTASSTRPFLPTVLSRCKIITLDNPNEQNNGESEAKIDSFLTSSLSEKLLFAQELAKDKEHALSQLESLVYVAHKRMQEYPENLSLAFLTQTLMATYNQAINTNINLRFLIEHALLQISFESEEKTI